MGRSFSMVRVNYLVIGEKVRMDGVFRKILGQVRGLMDNGFDVHLAVIGYGRIELPDYDFLTKHEVDDVPRMDRLGKLRRALAIRSAFAKLISASGRDEIIYLRFTGLFYQYPWNFLRPLRRCRIVSEHQSFEANEYLLIGARYYYLIDRAFGGFLRKQMDGIVSVTGQISEYQTSRATGSIKGFTLGNGFDVASVPLRQAPSDSRGRLEMLCVANVNKWHGLDRLIRGIASYSGDTSIRLHVVGEGKAMPSLVRLVGDLNVSEEVVFHGFKTGDELTELYSTCHIAVGSLGIHRMGLSEASTLKVREYCSRGIPFIYGIIDADFPSDFQYICLMPQDESDIDIEAVVDFSVSTLSDPTHPEKMRLFAEQNLDWPVKMGLLGHFLESL